VADFRAELTALVDACDKQYKWMINAKFQPLHQAVERARAALLAQPEPAPAADGKVIEGQPAHLALKRYGITWDGSPVKPLFARMTDGYWTPWHHGTIM